LSSNWYLIFKRFINEEIRDVYWIILHISYIFNLISFLRSWRGMGSLSCCLFYQFFRNSPLCHYGNLGCSYHFLFQPFSISLCRHTTKLSVGKLPYCSKRWPWKLYLLSLLLETEVAQNSSLSLMWKMYTGHGSPLPICKLPSSFNSEFRFSWLWSPPL
jgi:hypothetical protein